MKKTGTKIVSVLIAAILLLGAAPLSGFIGIQLPELNLSFSASADTYDGSCGKELTWRFDFDSGILTVVGPGAMTDWTSARSVPWAAHAKSITAVIIDEEVTSIGNYAFSGCTELSSLHIGVSVTSIGKNSFQSCKSLTEIDLSGCAGLTSIKENAFTSCSGAVIVKLPLTLESVGEEAFSSCSKISYIYAACDAPEGLESALPANSKLVIYFTPGLSDWTEPEWNGFNCWRNEKFIADSSILNDDNTNAYGILFTIDEINNFAMLGSTTGTANNSGYGGSNLGEVEIPAEVTKDGITYPVTAIAENALSGSCVKSVKIPKTVTAIGTNAFKDCKELFEIVVNTASVSFSSTDGVLFNNVGTQLIAYPAAKADTAYTVPDKVTSVKEGAFSGAANITELTLPFVGGSTGANTNLKYIFSTVPATLKKVILSSACTKIPEDAFYNCANITAVKAGENITEISEGAFSGCSGLTRIDLSACTKITALRESAFSGCKSLPELDFSASTVLTAIAKNCFTSCTSLTGITLPASLNTVGATAFKGCSMLKKLDIGAAVTALPVTAFEGCASLESVNVDKENENFSSDNSGVLFNKDKTKLIYYPQGRTRPYYTVPATVSSITKNAFISIDELQNVFIPQSVISITDGNFADCSLVNLLVYTGSVAHTYGNDNGLSFRVIDGAVMTGISIESEPTSSEYIVNTDFNFSGLYVVAIYDTFTVQIADDDYELIYVNDMLGKQDVKIQYTSDTGAVYTDTFKITVLREPPVSPTVSSVGDTFVELEAIDGCEYSDDLINWQDSTLFEGLDDDTEYNFFARYPADTSLAASAISRPATKATTTKHVWGDWETIQEPTCTSAGMERRDCQNEDCNSFESITVSALGHNYGSWTTTKEPTCTENGKQASVCTNCNVAIEREITAPGHNLGTWKTETFATCTQPGALKRACSACDYFETTPIAALGHETVKTAAKAATCTQKGNIAYWYCTACDKYFSDSLGTTEITLASTVLDMLAHTPVTDEAKEPTCTETGLTEGSHCSVCNTVITAQTEIAALGHSMVEIEEKAATCAETGSIECWQCTTCNKYFSDALGTAEITPESAVIAKLPHTTVTDEAKEPTCTQTGLTEGSHCSVCSEILVAQEVIPALGHSMTETPAKDATCTEDGNINYWYCGTCNKYFSDSLGTAEITLESTVLPKLGHTVVTDEAKEATCTASGLTEGSHCSVCDTILTAQETVPMLGHDWDDGTITTAPTCTEAGIKTFTCSRCAETNTEAITATGHTIVDDAAVTATCTEGGITKGSHCSVCSAVILAQKAINAPGHDWGTLIQKTAATCTEKGVLQRTCKRCGEITEKETNALGHKWSSWVSEPSGSCTVAGANKRTCSKCNEVETAVIPATEHRWGEWKTVKAATLTAAGSEQRRCALCSQTETRELPKLEAAALKVKESAGIKLGTDNKYVFIADGTSIQALLNEASDNAVVTTSAGKSVKASEKLCSGMLISLKSGGKTVDSMTIIVPSDVDGDGESTAADARLALRASVKLEKLNDWEIAAANVDFDGQITAADARLILRASVGLEKTVTWLTKH